MYDHIAMCSPIAMYSHIAVYSHIATSHGLLYIHLNLKITSEGSRVITHMLLVK